MVDGKMDNVVVLMAIMLSPAEVLSESFQVSFELAYKAALVAAREMQSFPERATCPYAMPRLSSSSIGYHSRG